MTSRLKRHWNDSDLLSQELTRKENAGIQGRRTTGLQQEKCYPSPSKISPGWCQSQFERLVVNLILPPPDAHHSYILWIILINLSSYLWFILLRMNCISPRCETRPWLPSRWLGEKPGRPSLSAWCKWRWRNSSATWINHICIKENLEKEKMKHSVWDTSKCKMVNVIVTIML
jgi:hypothetical protein